MPRPDPAVDIARRRSLSFAPSADHKPDPRRPDERLVDVPQARVARVVPQRAREARHEVNAFPVQAAKVQPPPLRDDILARDRLLDWLHAKIHQRLVLVLAEAGYGKTTLLADFAARTRLRTLWYRLDEDDRDWVTVMHHLVAAGREHDPDFAPRTASLLADTGVAGPARDAVLDAYLRELPAIAEHGVVLILDDFHLVDEAPDAKAIVRELVSRAPERVSIVIASRRPPSVPIARLRAAGEVAELRTDDLRFDADETARLFSETYGRSLEPDVLRDLSARTEGWAASLQLVQAALRDRSPLEIRRFVRNLSGADQELYDYLAEEVIGDLPDDLQQFLMRTSILQVVTPELAAVVTVAASAGRAATDDSGRALQPAEPERQRAARPPALPPAGAGLPRGPPRTRVRRSRRDHRAPPNGRGSLRRRATGELPATTTPHRRHGRHRPHDRWRGRGNHRPRRGGRRCALPSDMARSKGSSLATRSFDREQTRDVGLSRRALHRAQAIAESNPKSS